MSGGNGSDPFDPDQFRLTQEDMAAYKAPVREQAATRRKPQKPQFIMVPMDWSDRLAGLSSASANTYRVAHYVLHRHWKNNGQPFLAPNGALKAWGVSRFAKGRALAELERLGLILVEKRPKRSPKITVRA